MNNLTPHFFNSLAIIIGFSIVLAILTVFFKRRYNRHTYNQKLSKKILKKINSFEHDGQRINYLRKINPFVFEELVLDAMEVNGYDVKRNNRYTGDNGIDGVVSKNGITYLIQAKRYSNHINLSHLKDFNELTIKMNCKGFFVHTGRTGSGTWQESRNMPNVSIVSGSKFLLLLSTLNAK